MTLVVVAGLAAEQEDAVEAARERVGGHDGVDRPEAAHRDDPERSGPLEAIDAGHVQRRIGVVLARQDEDPGLLLVPRGISTALIVEATMSML